MVRAGLVLNQGWRVGDDEHDSAENPGTAGSARTDRSP